MIFLVFITNTDVSHGVLIKNKLLQCWTYENHIVLIADPPRNKSRSTAVAMS